MSSQCILYLKNRKQHRFHQLNKSDWYLKHVACFLDTQKSILFGRTQLLGPHSNSIKKTEKEIEEMALILLEVRHSAGTFAAETKTLSYWGKGSS
ncbi:hypothetical protein MKX01_003646 [Papaver californicum]|nr:hypothetical protein MKX01_003646 [Papaver californicum]